MSSFRERLLARNAAPQAPVPVAAPVAPPAPAPTVQPVAPASVASAELVSMVSAKMVPTAPAPVASIPRGPVPAMQACAATAKVVPPPSAPVAPPIADQYNGDPDGVVNVNRVVADVMNKGGLFAPPPAPAVTVAPPAPPVAAPVVEAIPPAVVASAPLSPAPAEVASPAPAAPAVPPSPGETMTSFIRARILEGDDNETCYAKARAYFNIGDDSQHGRGIPAWQRNQLRREGLLPEAKDHRLRAPKVTRKKGQKELTMTQMWTAIRDDVIASGVCDIGTVNGIDAWFMSGVNAEE